MHRKRYKAVLEEVVHELARDAISKLLVDETENNFQREDDDLVALPCTPLQDSVFVGWAS